MRNFIPEEEIRKDISILNRDDYNVELNIKVKREIGTKYGLEQKECSKTNNILNKIYEYLRDIRNTKNSFTKEDIHDFYVLTNYLSKYDKLYSFLMLETSTFIKFILDFEYNHLLSKGIRQYTLDNIDKISLNNDITHGSMQIRFYLERYKSIKKYYDENFGSKYAQAQNNDKLSIELQAFLLEETYEQRMQLEQILEDFINECYETYIYGSEEYIKIYKLMNSYIELRDKLSGGRYQPRLHEKVSPDVIKLNEYINELHLLLFAYRYFSPNCSATTHITKENRIENSIDYFNKIFDKTLNKTIINKIISYDNSLDINDIKIGELQKSNFGYYFIISYGNKQIYLNFGLQHENKNIDDMDDFIKHPKHINHLNYSTLIYDIKVTTKLYNKKINESFDFNQLNENNNTINLKIDDFNFNDESHIANQDIIDSEDIIKNKINFWNQFVDLGLPSGTLWCKQNFGIMDDSWPIYKQRYGAYVQWGDIIPNIDKPTGKAYVWTTYKHARGANNMLKKYITDTAYAAKNPDNNYHPYLDNLIELLPEDDIATQNLGEKFHIPTKEQFEELFKYTDNSWVILDNNISNWNSGRLFRSKINGNELFFPASGIMKDQYLNSEGSTGNYWTSSLVDTNNSMAWVFHFTSGSYFLALESRANGYVVRPVYNK